MSKHILECAHCGKEGPGSRMTIVRSNWTLGSQTRPGRLSFTVHKTCEEAFTANVMRIHAIENIVRGNAGAGFWSRIWHVPQLFDLKREIHVSKHGEKVARRAARNAVLAFLLPPSIALRLKFLNKPLDAKQKS